MSSHSVLLENYLVHRFLFKWNLAQIALVGARIHPQNGQRDNFTREPPLRDTKIMTSQSLWNYLSPLDSFRGLPLLSIPALWCQFGSFCSGNGSKHTYKPTVLQISTCLCSRGLASQTTVEVFDVTKNLSPWYSRAANISRQPFI